MQCFIITHCHRHGDTKWPIFSDKRPDEDEIIEALGEDFEEDRDESIGIDGPFDIPAPAAPTLEAIQGIIEAYSEAIDQHIWDKESGKADPFGYAKDVELVVHARAELAAIRKPRVAIAISGGTFQGACASVDVDIDIHDADNLEADGKDSDERDRLWDELTAGMVPVA